MSTSASRAPWLESSFRLLLRTYRWFFARRSFYRLNLFLHRLSMAGLGLHNFENHRVSGETHFLKNYLKEGDDSCTVIDVGAHHGEWSKAVLEVNPRARVFAFEPHPATYEVLKTVASITPLNDGCGRETETRALFDREDGDGSQHASLIEEAITVKGCHAVRHQVRIIKLDDFVRERRLARIDLLKIDAEGHEYAVLQGAARSIREGTIRAVQFEFNEMHVFARVFMNDFFELLSDYDFYRLLPSSMIPLPNYSPLSEIFAYQNVVAIRREPPPAHRPAEGRGSEQDTTASSESFRPPSPEEPAKARADRTGSLLRESADQLR